MMTRGFGQLLVAAAFTTAVSAPSWGQSAYPPNRDLPLGSTTFNVRNMTFDLWCQETQRYAIARCEARRPEDVKAFEDYRAAIERYELNYLKQVQRNNDQRIITNRDPTQTVYGKQDSTP